MALSGYIYILINASTDGIIKIGKTQRDPSERAKELSSATGVPTPFTVVYHAYFNDCDKAEKFVHTKLERYRVANNREFFKVESNIAIDTVIEAKNYYAKTETNNGEITQTLAIESEPLEPGQEMFDVGEEYYYGHSDKIQDYDEALNFYQRAARLGHAEEFLQMGIMYRDGEGRNPDSKRAIEHFKEAINHGNDEGWAEMAEIFHTEGHQQNEIKCWNNYFSSKNFANFGIRRPYSVYYYVVATITNNKPLEYKNQIRQVKNEILEIINHSAKEKGKAFITEKDTKVYMAIREL